MKAQVIPFPTERVRRPVANPFAVAHAAGRFVLTMTALCWIVPPALFFDALFGDREPPPPRLVGGQYDQQ